MIQLDHVSVGRWIVNQKASLANIDRERYLGEVLRTDVGRFLAILSDDSTIAMAESLPAAIHALIELHKLTDYQYAPWPAMEEDEE